MRVPEVLDGRYQITDEIGRGGMGAVFRALDRKTAQYVAIKVMLDASNQEFLALFDKEWRILAGLQHTNIIGISDRGEFQDGPAKYPYFVMPYLRGKTLHEWIHSGNGTNSVSEVVAVISAAAAGLQAAHNRGLVHRDVKPSNIFILESGSVVVIDFGIVHLGDSRTGTTLKGTTPYIAPELLDSDKNDKPSPQSDVFSLGVVCYEALTGTQPFSRATLTETIRAILKDIPRPAYEVNRNVSLLIGQVVQKSMAKNKNHRFKTISEFADQLQRASRNEELPQFGRHVIEDKVRVVREALAQGLVTQAHKMLRDIEDDGYIDPSITAQREKIDQLMQQKWIRSELESARIYRSNGEYATAMEKVSEVLNVVPDNAEALAELHQIRQKRLGKALGDAR
jgi:eukaryotic-like serine/threonine-protein kinase